MKGAINQSMCVFIGMVCDVSISLSVLKKTKNNLKIDNVTKKRTTLLKQPKVLGEGWMTRA